MESNLPPEDELALIERAAVAPWIDYAPAPWWYVPSAGLIAGTLVFVLGERETLPSVWYVLALLVVVMLIGAWIGAAMSRQGAVPRLRSAPPEFVSAVRAYFVGCVVLLTAVVTVFFAIGSRLAAIVAALGVAGGLYLHERRYAAAAEVVRRRVA